MEKTKDKIRIRRNMSYECQVLSTEMHTSCPYPRDCDCPHHVDWREAEWERQHKIGKKRPHSFPRKDWERKRPPGWHEARKKAGLSTRERA